MARRVVWTETAWRDLEGAAEFIAEDSPAYASAFVGGIRDRAASLEDMAERGRPVPELGEEAIRELIHGNYRLIYEVTANQVSVLGLIHGARDLGPLWPDRPQP